MADAEPERDGQQFGSVDRSGYAEVAGERQAGGPTLPQPVADRLGVEAHLGGHVALEAGLDDHLLLLHLGIEEGLLGDGGVAVGIRADADHVDVGPTIQERTQESGGIGEGATGVGVSADHEHLPDALLVDPLHDAVDVRLVLDHAGGEVRDRGVAVVGERGTQVERVIDRLGG